jgi:hypothetical protein
LLVLCAATAERGAAQSTSSGTSAKPAANGLILGRVVEGLTNAGVADALVNIVGVVNGQRVELATITESSGAFVLFNVPAGSFSFRASKPGYWFGSYRQRRPNGPGRSLELAPGQHVTSIAVPMWKYGAISGRVMDESGEPLAGVEVRFAAAWPRGGRMVYDTRAPSGTRTDDRGQYRFSGAFPRTYLVYVPSSHITVSASSGPAGLTPGSPNRLELGEGAIGLTNALTPPVPAAGTRVLVYPTVFYPTADTVGEATPLVLAPGEERTGIDFQVRLTETYRVSGRLASTIAGSTGGVRVRLARRDLKAFVDDDVASTLSEADGAFTLAAVPAGSYVLKASDAPPPKGVGVEVVGATVAPADVSVGARYAELPLTVGQADLTNLSLVLRPTLQVEGQVVFEDGARAPAGFNVTSVLMSVQTPGGLVASAPRPDATGRFQTEHLAPGPYFVAPTQPGVSAGWALKSISLNGRDVTDAAIELGDEDVRGLIVTLTDKVSEVRGRVRATDGAVEADASVLVFTSDPQKWTDFGGWWDTVRFYSARVAPDGGYVLRSLVPGDYLIVAVKKELTEAWQTVENLEALTRNATRLRIALGQQVAQDLQTVRP